MVLCTVFLMCAYLLKPATSDLSRYSVYFNSGFTTDRPYSVTSGGDVMVHPSDTTGEPFLQAFDANPGFGFFARVIHSLDLQRPILPRFAVFKKRYVSDGPVVVILLMGLGCLLLSCLSLLHHSRELAVLWSRPQLLLYWMPLILGSLFFMLGSQNALRQFLGLIFLMIAISFLFERRVFWSVMTLAAAISFHQWSVVFFGIACCLFYGEKIISSSFRSGPIEGRSITAAVGGLILGCLAVAVVKTVVSGVLETIDTGILGQTLSNVVHNLSIYSEVKQYVRMDWSNLPSRMGGITKVALLGGLLVLSEALLGKATLPTRWNIRVFRIGLFCFLAPLAIYPEILSRLVLFYLAVETLFVCMAVSSNQMRARLAGSIVFIAYGVAPNGLTILLGREWLTRVFG